jgi:hypothetical protein
MKVIKEDKPLPEHTKLDYYECYAKIVLEEMFSNRFFDLVIHDKPDLQNEKLSIGIEVTSSINPKQKEAESLYVKWYDQSNEGKEKIEVQIKKCGAKLNNGILSGISSHDNFDRIYTDIKNKIGKLDQYRSFVKQYLFIFSDIYSTSDMREKALEEMQHICYLESPKLDAIYVLVPGALYVFNLVKNITFIREINANMQSVQASNAREMVIQEEKAENKRKQQAATKRGVEK